MRTTEYGDGSKLEVYQVSGEITVISLVVQGYRFDLPVKEIAACMRSAIDKLVVFPDNPQVAQPEIEKRDGVWVPTDAVTNRNGDQFGPSVFDNLAQSYFGERSYFRSTRSRVELQTEGRIDRQAVRGDVLPVAPTATDTQQLINEATDALIAQALDPETRTTVVDRTMNIAIGVDRAARTDAVVTNA